MSVVRDNEYRAYLTLVGEFDPETISQRLGLEPTSAWRRGELNPKTQFERKASRWNLDSRLEATAALEDQVADVLVQIGDRRDKVADLRKAFDGCVQLVAYFYQTYPGFGLSETVVRDLANMGLGIDCDFYYLYSDRREDSE